MNAHALEAWITGTWWPFVGSATIASSLVFLLVLVVWLAIRRRASAHLGYALFLLPLVTFVIPLQGLFPLHVASSTPFAYILPGAEQPQQAEQQRGRPPRRVARGDTTAATTRIAEPVPTRAQAGAAGASLQASAHPVPRPGRWPLAIFAVWFAAALTLASRWVIANYRTHRMARRATALRDPRLKLLTRQAAARIALPIKVRFAETPAVHAPAVCGLWRPVLLLPTGFGETMDDASISWSLQHELAHIRRRDLIVDSLQRALRVLWWFHPTLLLLDRVVNELRECACDEEALARLPHVSRRSAAGALLDAIESSRLPATGGLVVESLYSNKTRLEKRIMRLIDSRRKRQLGLTSPALWTLLLTGSLGLMSTQLVTSPAAGGASSSAMLDQTGAEEIVEEPLLEIVEEPLEQIVLEEILEEEVEEEPLEQIEEVEEDTPASAAVERSLQWIVARQHEDGHWDPGTSRDGTAGEFTDVGITALAIECLLASSRGEHQRAAGRGLDWLASSQDETLGLFGDQQGFGFIPSHALATRVWIRSHPAPLEGRALRVASRALQFCQASQNPYGGWRYNYPPDGDGDSFVTSLMMRALAAARERGLEAPGSSIESGNILLDYLMDEKTGRVGYASPGEPAGRLAGKDEDFPPRYSEYSTALTMLATLELDGKQLQRPAIQKSGDLIAQVSPSWNPVKGTNDGYYWMFGMQAMRLYGGERQRLWQTNLIDALVPNQRADGSWPLMDAWSGDDDYVHMTCVYTRALQEALAE